VGNLRERDNLENLVRDGRWIVRKWDGTWTGLIWLRIGKIGGRF